ncbi:phage major capsid protein [Mesorhizobium sp. M0139]|uniref:phage major capsid protein n=1 Tax=Mesorhizobium sp. M0139 TaxID=2956892 RepID=UPI00333D3BBA
MPFSAQELDNIGQAVMEYKQNVPNVTAQTLQDKPLLAKMRDNTKEFPGGKDNITVRVKGVYSTTIQGFEHDDAVTYGNPANLKTATYPWKLIHSGISFTMHELLKAGISISDSATGKGETRHSENEKIVLVDLLEDKVDDMMEGTDRGMNEMFWRDGTQDAKQVPGLLSFILDDPTTATVVGGIDQSVNTWWRNRASLAIASSDASLQGLVARLQKEFRQLRRYGGRPDLFLAGSDFIEWMEKELRSKGNYTLEGWTSKGKTDAGMADISFKGLQVQYDPTLDDLSKSKYGYVLDTKHIFPKVVQGENAKKHTPARPENKYVFYRAQTWVGGLVCDQRNCHGVYSIA